MDSSRVSSHRMRFAAIAFWLAVSPAIADGPRRVDSFKPVGFFKVPGGGAAEIAAAGLGGKMVVYTDSIRGKVGFVSIERASDPVLVGEYTPESGEPTSVATSPDGSLAVVTVKRYAFADGDLVPESPPQGVLLVFKLLEPSAGAFSFLGEIPLGLHPDSVSLALVRGRLVAVVAIENEPLLVDAEGKYVTGDSPDIPAGLTDRGGKGFVQVVTLDTAVPMLSQVVDVRFDDEEELAAIGLAYPADPQPEYVAIHSSGKVAVTLQENSGIAIIDIREPTNPVLVRVFALPKATDRAADLKNDLTIDFSQIYPAQVDLVKNPHAGEIMPDAIAWHSSGTALYTANEGEQNFTGSRGWSAFSPTGDLLWDDAGSLEAKAAARGMYPSPRSGGKGIEPEGLATSRFGGREFAFVSSERGSFVAVYDIQGPTPPVFLQMLPTGLRPEGILPIPSRGILVTAEEGANGGSMTIFQGIPGGYVGTQKRPMVYSAGVSDPFAALSGLAADPWFSWVLYSVPDDALPSRVYRIDVQGAEARVETLFPVSELNSAGVAVQARFDLEGIAVDSSILAPGVPGFWLASEGNAAYATDKDPTGSKYKPNLLIQVDAHGTVLRKIKLPEELDPSPPTIPASLVGKVRNNGFEGVTISANGRYLLAAIQREHQGEVANGGALHARIARYDLVEETWEFFLYPFDATESGVSDDWMGLSEITHLGRDLYAVIERDKQVAALAKVKRVYTFRLDGVEPFDGVVAADTDLTGKVIRKRLAFDVLEQFAPFEKVEGLAPTIWGLWAVLDNDGGICEPRLVDLGRVRR